VTVSPQGPGDEVAIPQEEMVGLEDMGVGDLATPRVSIMHAEGLFKDNLTSQTFDTMRIIILGLVKQRSLFHEDVDDGDKPMCRSNDFDHGYPVFKSDVASPKKDFPWARSRLSNDQVEWDENGRPVVQCKDCFLKEWKSDPTGEKPYCTELWTLPLLMDPFENDNWVPAVLTFKKTQIKPLKVYLSNYRRANTASFTSLTEVNLHVNRRGQVLFSTPEFRSLGPTDSEKWRDYAKLYAEMRGFLMSPPRFFDENEAQQATDNTATPAMQPPAPPQGPAQPPVNDPWAVPPTPAENWPPQQSSTPVGSPGPTAGGTTPPQVSAPAAEARPDASSAPPPAEGTESPPQQSPQTPPAPPTQAASVQATPPVPPPPPTPPVAAPAPTQAVPPQTPAASSVPDDEEEDLPF